MDGRKETKVGVSFGQWEGGLKKDSEMENVDLIRKTVQVLSCILRKTNVIPGLVRGMKLMNDINSPYFKLISSLVLYVDFEKGSGEVKNQTT